MKSETLTCRNAAGRTVDIPLHRVHSLVIGSGAAGLNAAVQLRARGVRDVAIITEGLDRGTSVNAGSDKQTYYKLSLCGDEPDSPRAMAETYVAGGSMHGDLALTESALSTRAFFHLVDLGVPFPADAYGQYTGYKTDHDPRRRATSIGPYTSRDMCRALRVRVKDLVIPVLEDRHVAELLTLPEGAHAKRVVGALAMGPKQQLEAYAAENVVLAVGGPGGLYKTSVYPESQEGGIGLALMAGARARSLPESQYGIASTGFRWNVSGSYMQAMPRIFSTTVDGENEREFLVDLFDSSDILSSSVFLKGYQWPFDVRKASGGSSLIDLLVYRENVLRGRRVYLDFRRNASGFDAGALAEEARDYLARSGALLERPIDRLSKMNPDAVELYAEHGIDIASVPLEIAVCAQHNNGGLAANHWWESVNVKHLFPVGEVNGSHGVYRPGGSALNAGQVGGFRAADYIARCYSAWTVPQGELRAVAGERASAVLAWLDACRQASRSWTTEREAWQTRMTHAGAHVRSLRQLEEAVEGAWAQCRSLETSGCGGDGVMWPVRALASRHLCFAHAVYLDAIRYAVADGVGSRGSALVLDPAGRVLHEKLGPEWRMQLEDETFREKVLETEIDPGGCVRHRWVERRPIPEDDTWFETAWARYRDGSIYRD